ncbi:MAG: FtsQ-type POTRA domain-containing protein [Deltaproteobacteria bacterium]|jgi:cell division protein FtsQ|nr:FtsQ-type POTRA domain-containing protein [Deltaproteobacteria bacterium]
MKDYKSTFNKSNNNKPIQKTILELGFRRILKISVSICVFCFILFLLIQIPGKITSPLKNIMIHGNNILDKTTIAKYLGVYPDQSWFDIDPYVFSTRLKQLNWVDTVIVRKNFWEGIDVTITERSPIAFLRVKDKTWFICEDGLILDLIQQKKAWDLPVIVNDSLSEVREGEYLNLELLSDAVDIIKLLNKNSILPISTISEIIITDPINIKLISIPYGIEIRLGYENFDLKLARLSRAIPKLNDYIHNIDYIDLRHSDGVVFKKIH